jgi:hypothetical protein
MSNYVQYYSTVTVDDAKSAIRIDPDDESHDTIVGFYLSAAKSMADNYCQQPSFAPAESGDTVTIPAPVEAWVIQTTVRLFEQRQTGVKSVDTKETEKVEWNAIDFGLLQPYRNFWAVAGIPPAPDVDNNILRV